MIKFLILIFVSLLLAVPAYAQYQINYQVVPDKIQNPGELYTIKLKALRDGNPCQKCQVNIKTIPQAEPLDNIQPQGELVGTRNGLLSSSIDNFIVGGYTNSEGLMDVNINSYASGKRDYMIWIGANEASSSAYTFSLPYSDNPVLSVMSMVGRLVQLKLKPPPMGNIYPKAVSQRYIGNQSREVHLKYNKPIGTKFYEIKAYDEEARYQASTYQTSLIISKRTESTDYVIEVDAFKNIVIEVQGCSKENSCVGSTIVTVPKLDEKLFTSPSEDIEVPNKGLGTMNEQAFDDNLIQEQKSIDNPFAKMFQVIYSLF